MAQPVVLPLVPSPPKVRGDCLPGGTNEHRPCPWSRCFYNAPDAAPGEPTCVLDVADEGGVTHEVVAKMFGVTEQRAGQIEMDALRKIRTRNYAVYQALRAFHK
jgi:hypothetical protein